MGQLSDNQRRVLEILKVERGWWKASQLAEMLGARPQSMGMALKGLYKRGLTDRRAPERNAEYRITKAGIKEIQRGE